MLQPQDIRPALWNLSVLLKQELGLREVLFLKCVAADSSLSDI